MPFRLKNYNTTYQQMMNKIFKDLIKDMMAKIESELWIP